MQVHFGWVFFNGLLAVSTLSVIEFGRVDSTESDSEPEVRAPNQCFSPIPTAPLDSTRASLAVVLAEPPTESFAAYDGAIAAEVC
ncbi:hypothetical protein LBMAG49_04380 [Planctomycetota bacterium]|nr:hypothetical protein LBMAG49_04380 [Planctomycetota bacterium]